MKSDFVYLRHIMDAIDKIESYASVQYYYGIEVDSVMFSIPTTS